MAENKKLENPIVMWGLLGAFFALILYVGYDIYSSSKKKSAVREPDYLGMCQQMIKQQAQYPASVKHKVFSTNVYRAANGNVAVTAPFAAKNGFGAELEHTARCIFEPDGQREITIQ